MNTEDEIRWYREQEREALFELARWFAQVIMTPALLLLILWRVW
jgi:hypothetical protein